MSEQLEWQWPNTGPTPVNHGLDNEIFDSEQTRLSETFVREAIQNSLDAKLSGEEPVLVSFSFSDAMLQGHRSLLEDLRKKRADCGLEEWPEQWDAKKITWLSVEDSNSTGLEGSLEDRNSDFWHYWLNFGLSNKDGQGRGGRGIGRVTFLIASGIHTVFGLTRQKDGGKLAACGMSVLKPGNHGGKWKTGYAYLAEKERDDIFELYDPELLQKAFSSSFGIMDRASTDTTGLSLVIPYPHDDLQADRLTAAAIEHFAPALLKGSLIVEVDGKSVNSATIDEEAIRVQTEFATEAMRQDPERIISLIRTLAGTPEYTIDVDKTPGAFEKMDEETLDKIRKTFERKREISLAINLKVRRSGTDHIGRFHVALARVQHNLKSADLFFRDGMKLPDVRARDSLDIDAVIQSDYGPLSTYLNFCEGKAHLDLLENHEIRRKLEEQGFEDGVSIRRLAKRLPDDLRRLVSPDITEPDSTVFSEFFAAPKENSSGKRRKPKRKTIIIDKPPEPRMRIFLIDDLRDGFRVRANPAYENWPVSLRLSVAYADGSAKPKWQPFDFRFRDLSVSSSGSDKPLYKDNDINCQNCSNEFELEVSGFDKRRELVLNLKPYRNA